MEARRLLFLQLFLIGIVAALHLIGTALYLYWVLWWYDLLVHFLASIWVALAVSWASVLGKKHPSVLFVMGCVFIVGIAWEIFEFSIGATYATQLVFDTALDLCVNIFGGFTGLFIARRVQSTITP